jgi:tetratricopeptide (TPR) repeat protein
MLMAAKTSPARRSKGLAGPMQSVRRLAGMLLVLSAWPPARAADAADTLVPPALAAEARFDARTALGLFLKADAARPNDPFILEKIAKQYSDSIDDTADVDEKRRRAEKAVAFAQRAVALDPKSAVAVTALAISYGKLGFYCDTRTELAYSRLVKDCAERACALDPNYAWAWHVLGRWNCEIARLGSTKRFLAKLFYGGLPPAATTEAVRLLRRAIQLDPQVPAHHVELGFAYLVDKQPGLARIEFEEAIRLPLREKYDIEEKRRARAALAELR